MVSIFVALHSKIFVASHPLGLLACFLCRQVKKKSSYPTHLSRPKRWSGLKDMPDLGVLALFARGGGGCMGTTVSVCACKCVCKCVYVSTCKHDMMEAAAPGLVSCRSTSESKTSKPALLRLWQHWQQVHVHCSTDRQDALVSYCTATANEAAHTGRHPTPRLHQHKGFNGQLSSKLEGEPDSHPLHTSLLMRMMW